MLLCCVLQNSPGTETCKRCLELKLCCQVALIGSPNVGKSTLFNRLVGRRQALVSKVAAQFGCQSP